MVLVVLGQTARLERSLTTRDSMPMCDAPTAGDVE